MSARAERRAMIALLAAFALLVQVLIPSLAMAAAPPADGQALMICTDHGLQPAPADAPDRQTPGGPCDHCVCPPGAAGLPPQLGVAFAYAETAVRADVPLAKTPLWPPARAPPRPPGQGPPTLQA